jgi:glycerol-3-phosphate acyltransferase PlsX
VKVIVDALGGDNAPLSVVEGAVAAAAELKTEVILVGSGEEILRCFQKLGISNLPKGIEIANTTEVITMEDDPSRAVREKKDSSMAVMLAMLRDGAGAAAVSAGSTGALLSGATLVVKRIRGIRRAALAPVIPTKTGGSVLLDSGANAECSLEYLLQFAYMGSAYARCVLGKERPSVALLNIGAEESKARNAPRGYRAQEGRHAGQAQFVCKHRCRDVFDGGADVIVCDGFPARAAQGMECTALYLMGELKASSAKSTSKAAALLVKKELAGLKSKLDYGEVGGSMFLGIARPVIKAHGSSDARAIKNAIGQAAKIAASGLIDEITGLLEDMQPQAGAAAE